MYDVIVIGAGPGGISASLYIKRAGKKVAVLYHGISELQQAEKIENYYGFENGITGEELYQDGIKQAKNLGIEVLEKEVTNIETKGTDFVVKTSEGDFQTKAVIIATGNKKVKPNIKGINEFEGKGISYCAICDGFFYRNKKVAIIGNGKFALSEAEDLKNIVNEITIFTNGLEAPLTKEYEINTKKIKEIQGEKRVNSLLLEDGTKVEVDGIFVAQGVAGGSDFAKKLGILMNNDTIVVNSEMETNLPGIYACGNLTGGLLQVNKAVYEGAKAGLQAVNYLRKNKEEKE